MDDDYDNDLDRVVQDMLDDFKSSKNATEDNRSHALDILDFVRPGADQWDPDDKTNRKGRPSYSFNQLPKYGRQVTNDMRQNMPMIKYIPGNDKEASKEGATIREDLMRAIQTTTEAEVAYDIASDSQVTIGWGYWSLITDYENDENFDQVVKYRSIINPFMVYDDPFALQPDRSDRSFLIELEDYTLSRFNRTYGKNYKSDDYNGYDYDNADLVSIGDAYPDWVDQTNKIIRVGHYWKVKYSTSQMWQHKKTGKIVTEEPKNIKDYNSRDIQTKKVMVYKCTARDKLEEQEFIIDEIPYFYVEGVCTYVDGKKYITGLYEDAISVQKLYNYSLNSAIELMALAPKQPFIGDYRAFKGMEKAWGEANQKAYPYLPYNGVDDNGQPIQPPQRQQNSADLGSATTMMQLAEQNFSATIGLYDANISKTQDQQSGRAIGLLQKRGDASTFHYPDNMARAQRYCGRVGLKLISAVYDGARMVKLMSEDKKSRVVPINQTFVDDDGQEKKYDMTLGVYDVVVTVGPSYATKRQEEADALTQLAQAYPPLMQAAGDEIVRSMDFPNSDKIADRLQKLLPPQLQEQPDMKNVPPQVQSQMQQMGQMIEQLQQQLQAGGQELQQAQAELQSKNGELQVKMADVQAGAQADQTDAQIKAAQLQLDQQELEFEKQKAAYDNMLEQKKIELESVKIMVTQIQPAIQALTAPQQPQVSQAPDNSGNELIQADMEQRNQQGVVLLQQLQGLQEAVLALTASVQAPKVVMRDPNTGLVSGVAPMVN